MYSSPTVSADSKTVYAVARGKRVAVLHACTHEVFFPSKRGPTSPAISPDGRWLLVERVYPFQPHGRVDESTVLLDLPRGRAYASTAYGPALGVRDLTATTWVRGRPATVRLDGAERVREVALPGALAAMRPPNRCP